MPSDPAISPSGERRLIVVLLSIITIILVGWALRYTQLVTMPLIFAFFLAAVLRPVQTWLDDHLPERLCWMSLVLTLLLLLGVLAVAVVAIVFAAQMVASGMSEYQQAFQSLWQNAHQWAASRGIPLDRLSMPADTPNRLMGWAFSGLSSLTSLLVFLVLVFFLLLFMLLEAGKWRRKSWRAMRGDRARAVVDTVETIAQKLRQYLWNRTQISLISGIVEGLWLWLVGVDFWLVWGLLFFLMNYIPNVGSAIAMAPPVLLALVQPEMGPVWALITLAGLLVIEQIIGYYIDPRLQGRTLELSPTVVLVSILFWGWLWGIAGTLLAVPMTVAIIIICAHVGPLKPLTVMLSESDRRSSAEAAEGPPAVGDTAKANPAAS